MYVKLWHLTESFNMSSDLIFMAAIYPYSQWMIFSAYGAMW